jgi:hypothetical protein
MMVGDDRDVARGETDMVDVRTYKYFAGGVWREAEDARTFDVVEPDDLSP